MYDIYFSDSIKLTNINMQTAKIFKVQVTQLYLGKYLYIILLYKVSITTNLYYCLWGWLQTSPKHRKLTFLSAF